MINNDVVPFPLSFLRFRHTGTDIYDVKKWDVHVWRQKTTRLPNQKIVRYSFRRHSQELQRTLRKVDRHHDTFGNIVTGANDSTSSTNVLYHPEYDWLCYVAIYPLPTTRTIQHVIWLIPELGIVRTLCIPCSNITNTNHCNVINERHDVDCFIYPPLPLCVRFNGSFTKYTDTVNIYTLLPILVTARTTIVPMSAIIIFCCMSDMTYNLRSTTDIWSIFLPKHRSKCNSVIGVLFSAPRVHLPLRDIHCNIHTSWILGYDQKVAMCDASSIREVFQWSILLRYTEWCSDTLTSATTNLSHSDHNTSIASQLLRSYNVTNRFWFSLMVMTTLVRFCVLVAHFYLVVS